MKKLLKSFTSRILTGLRSQRQIGHFDRGNQGRSLFEKARNREALRVGNKNARIDRYF